MSESAGERWLGARDLFDRALAQPVAEREGFVDRHAGGDERLAQAVKQLLLADREAGEFLADPISPAREAASAPEASARPPVRIGPYRIAREIGRGGTGTVYLAQRDDASFRRRVAIKVVRADLRDEHLESRLRVERQVLAGLDHPNIAKVFDGGATADGAPYLAMEFIEGVPIDRYCDDHQLGVDARLDLFRSVCDAVAHAHGNLVVHRDLKPSNILVTADGIPKLLDFGIAKLLNPDLFDIESQPTSTWQRILTPHYASPEQIRGGPITTASDIYSLGVLLYLLLTGHLPRRFTGLDAAEIRRRMADSEPRAPSTIVLEESNRIPTGPVMIAEARGTLPDVLRRRLVGDLDAIVLKTLRSAPNDRYHAADRLADDIRRHQERLPVLARRGTWRYRTARLLQRHRRLAAFVGVVLVGLLSFVMALGIQSVRLEQERDRARVERDEKASLLGLLLDLLRNVDPMAGGDRGTTLEAVLARSGPLIDQRLGNAPTMHAETLHTLGEIAAHLGDMQQARAHLETALAIRRETEGMGHQDVGETLTVLATVLAELGEPAAGEAAREAIAIQRRQSSAAGGDAALARSLIAQARVLCIEGDFDRAEAPAAEALGLARSGLARSGPARPGDDATLLADALATQAVIDGYHGRDREAADRYREALDLSRATLGDGHLRQVPMLQSLGAVLGRSGELEAAETALARALDIQRSALGTDSPSLVPSLANLAGILGAGGDHARSADTYRQALGVIEATVGREHPRALYVECRIAEADLAAGNGVAGFALRALLPPWRARLGDDHPFVALADGVVGATLASAGRTDEAESLLVSSFARLKAKGRARDRQEAFARLEQFYGAGDARLAPFRAQLAERDPTSSN